MSTSAIHVEGLGKRYLIDHQQEGGHRYLALRDVLANAVKSAITAGARFLGSSKKEHYTTLQREEFWALKDVTFTVNKGDRLGIIGPNGAGKSTLLKLLSRITDPSRGWFTLEGRVSSLLEVGTGFHPELTGRENIFLNGAILGMGNAEIRRKFDEIVAFADVEKFLDTPVKRYSSGMYVRLAFSVSAHLEPEVLIVDEVLAVGDAAFQRKCLGKMEEVGKEGRTVLFVSHNMPMIKQLCNKGVVLNRGTVAFNGKIDDAVAFYEEGLDVNASGWWKNDNEQDFVKKAFIKSIELVDDSGRRASAFLNTDAITIRMVMQVNEVDRYLKVGFDLVKNAGVVFRCEQVDSPEPVGVLDTGTHMLTCHIPKNVLNAGRYYLIPQVSIHCVVGLRASQAPVIMFDVAIDSTTSEFHVVLNDQNHPGAVFPLLTWRRE